MYRCVECRQRSHRRTWIGVTTHTLEDADCRTGILLATTIIYSYIEIATKEGTPGLAGMADILG